jgi:hypothetical protein
VRFKLHGDKILMRDFKYFKITFAASRHVKQLTTAFVNNCKLLGDWFPNMTTFLYALFILQAINAQVECSIEIELFEQVP